jgi:hypothetical protein
MLIALASTDGDFSVFSFVTETQLYMFLMHLLLHTKREGRHICVASRVT